MPALSRRAAIAGASALGAALGLGGCARNAPSAQNELRGTLDPGFAGGVPSNYLAMYGPADGGRFPIPAVNLSTVDSAFLRREIPYATREAPGTIVIDPPQHYLYFVLQGGRAMRYGVGVGGEGFAWSGIATVHDKQEWPDWYPPPEMLQRRPELRKDMVTLQSGIGMPGSPRNPLGARAMYLWQGNRDTLYRIHGTNEPHTIGRSVSSGCVRMINQDVIDLYQRTPVGAKVAVLAVASASARSG